MPGARVTLSRAAAGEEVTCEAPVSQEEMVHDRWRSALAAALQALPTHRRQGPVTQSSSSPRGACSCVWHIS